MLDLVELVQLSPEALAQARAEALEVEQRAYEFSKDVYAKTQPAEPPSSALANPVSRPTQSAATAPVVKPTQPAATPPRPPQVPRCRSKSAPQLGRRSGSTASQHWSAGGYYNQAQVHQQYGPEGRSGPTTGCWSSPARKPA